MTNRRPQGPNQSASHCSGPGTGAELCAHLTGRQEDGAFCFPDSKGRETESGCVWNTWNTCSGFEFGSCPSREPAAVCSCTRENLRRLTSHWHTFTLSKWQSGAQTRRSHKSCYTMIGSWIQSYLQRRTSTWVFAESSSALWILPLDGCWAAEGRSQEAAAT